MCERPSKPNQLIFFCSHPKPGLCGLLRQQVHFIQGHHQTELQWPCLLLSFLYTASAATAAVVVVVSTAAAHRGWGVAGREEGPECTHMCVSVRVCALKTYILLNYTKISHQANDSRVQRANHPGSHIHTQHATHTHTRTHTHKHTNAHDGLFGQGAVKVRRVHHHQHHSTAVFLEEDLAAHLNDEWEECMIKGELEHNRW